MVIREHEKLVGNTYYEYEIICIITIAHVSMKIGHHSCSYGGCSQNVIHSNKIKIEPIEDINIMSHSVLSDFKTTDVM